MGTVYPKPEFPPLLTPGQHRMTLDRVMELCVNGFPLSKTRQKIFDELRNLLGTVTRLQIASEVWINGSFLTEKIDPDDVDILFRLPAFRADTLWGDQSEFMHNLCGDDVAARNAISSHCDCHWSFVSDNTHPRHAEFEHTDKFWVDSFKFAFMSRQRKGIAVLEVCDGFAMMQAKHHQSISEILSWGAVYGVGFDRRLR